QAKSGFEIENAKHITLNNVHVDVENESFLQAKNVRVLNLTNIQNNTPKAGRPMIVLADVTDANIQQSFPSVGTDTFVELVGDNNKGVFIHSNNLNNVRQTVDGATAAAVVTNNIEAQKK